MRRIHFLIPVIFLLLLLSTSSLSQKSDPNIERRINALLARMTLAEKLGQLQQLAGDGEVAS
jgi:hypothetical protein